LGAIRVARVWIIRRAPASSLPAESGRIAASPERGAGPQWSGGARPGADPGRAGGDIRGRAGPGGWRDFRETGPPKTIRKGPPRSARIVAIGGQSFSPSPAPRSAASNFRETAFEVVAIWRPAARPCRLFRGSGHPGSKPFPTARRRGAGKSPVSQARHKKAARRFASTQGITKERQSPTLPHAPNSYCHCPALGPPANWAKRRAAIWLVTPSSPRRARRKSGEECRKKCCQAFGGRQNGPGAGATAPGISLPEKSHDRPGRA